MSRAAYCRRQAVLCHEMAKRMWMTDQESAAKLHMMARHYPGGGWWLGRRSITKRQVRR